MLFFFLGKIVDDDHYLSKLNHQYICLEYIHHVGMVSHHHEILKQRKSQWPTHGFKNMWDDHTATMARLVKMMSSTGAQVRSLDEASSPHQKLVEMIPSGND